MLIIPHWASLNSEMHKDMDRITKELKKLKYYARFSIKDHIPTT